MNKRIRVRFFSVLATATIAISAIASPWQPKVIYGDDNRLDLYDVKEASTLALADSTVALMDASRLVPQKDGSFGINAQTLRDYFQVCSEERFSEQPTAASCSGSLVGPDLVLTAGHCISQYECADTRFVFGYALRKLGDVADTAPASEVYSCAKVLISKETAGADFAVVRLDRPVTGHLPLAINRGAVPAVGTEVGVIGHPSGLPVKAAFGAQVRHDDAGFFVTNLDTYGGNSGSAVFNAKTGLIEGVLVRGETDFELNGSCYVSKRCPADGCRGEDVTHIQEAAPYIPAIR